MLSIQSFSPELMVGWGAVAHGSPHIFDFTGIESEPAIGLGHVGFIKIPFDARVLIKIQYPTNTC